MRGDCIEPRGEMEAANESWTEDDSGENFADYSGLAQLNKQKTEQVG